MNNVYSVDYKGLILRFLQLFVVINLLVVGVQFYFIIDARAEMRENVYTITTLESQIAQYEEKAKRAGIPPGGLYGPPEISKFFVLEKLSCHEGFAQFKNISNQTFSSAGKYFEIFADNTKIAGESCQGGQVIAPGEACLLTFRSLSPQQELRIEVNDLERKENPMILIEELCRELTK